MSRPTTADEIEIAQDVLRWEDDGGSVAPEYVNDEEGNTDA